MKPKDEVMIYEDPITKERQEGPALLVKCLRPDDGSGVSLWEVEFLDAPGETCARCVYEEQ